MSVPSSTARLRRATADDLPALVALEDNSGPGRWNHAAFAAELRTTWSHVLILESAPQPGESPVIMGFMIYWCVADETQLLNITVHGQHRRQGWGRFLMDDLLRRATEAGHHRIVLEVRRSNGAAQQLYLAFNFQPVGVRRRYYADNNEDAILMERQICQP